MKILYYSPFSPVPQDSGVALRVMGTLQSLYKSHTVDFMVLANRDQALQMCSDGSDVKRMVRQVHTLNFGWGRKSETRRRDQIAAILSFPTENFRRFKLVSVLNGLRKCLTEEKFDVLYLETEFAAVFLHSLIPILRQQGTRSIVSFLDVLSVMARRNLSQMRRGVYQTRYWADAKKLEHFERRILDLADAAVAVSETDRSHLARWSRRPVYVVPNGMDIPDTLPPRNNNQQNPILLFVGWIMECANE